MNINSNEILVKQILNICFPVGKIEIFYDNLDHSNYMGFTWQRCLSERSPIGYNPSSTDSYKTVGSQFGEKRHTLTVDEIPSHNHSTTRNQPVWVQSNTYGSLNPGAVSGANRADIDTIQYVGGDQSHNNIHPVEVVAFWKRIS